MPLFMIDLLGFVSGEFSRLRRHMRGLSGRVLVLTLGVVFVAEGLIMLPTLADFRTQWFKERIEAAQLAALVVTAAEGGSDPAFGGAVDTSSGASLSPIAENSANRAIIPPALRAELLDNAEVKFIRLEHDDANQLVLAAPDVGMAEGLVDLRQRDVWTALAEVCHAVFTPQPAFIRVRDTPRMERGQLIEIIVPGEALARDFWAFARRVLAASLGIIGVTGAIVYGALLVLFVRPMRRLAGAMVTFRQAPEAGDRVISPSGRGDEIGQAEVELAAMQTDVRRSLAERQRLAALGTAVAKINHDLRNVFTSAQLISDRLAASPDPKTRGQGERLVRSIGRGVRLTQDVLNYGRSQERPPDPVDLDLIEVLRDAWVDAASVAEATPVIAHGGHPSSPGTGQGRGEGRGEGVAIDLALDPGVCVRVDRDHVHRIFVNLLRNAVQAIAFQPARSAPGQITVTAAVAATAVDITIADNGPGLPKRAQDKVFQPFAASTRKEGSGLGLSIARELARANGGDLSLVNTGPAGAVFRVTLVRAAADCACVDPDDQAQTPRAAE